MIKPDRTSLQETLVESLAVEGAPRFRNRLVAHVEHLALADLV
jgi:hypothetical protein